MRQRTTAQEGGETETPENLPASNCCPVLLFSDSGDAQQTSVYDGRRLVTEVWKTTRRGRHTIA